MRESQLRSTIRQLIREEEEEMVKGEEHDEEEDVEDRVGVENAESGNYYNVRKSHALNNPQKYSKIREAVRREIKRVLQEGDLKKEAAGRREKKNLGNWLMDINDIASDFSDRLAERIADTLELSLSDEVYVEPLEPRTVNQLVQNPDVDLVDIGNDMIVLFFGPDNPGLEGFEKFVALGKSQGMRPFWLLYAPKYAK